MWVWSYSQKAIQVRLIKSITFVRDNVPKYNLSKKKRCVVHKHSLFFTCELYLFKVVHKPMT